MSPHPPGWAQTPLDSAYTQLLLQLSLLFVSGIWTQGSLPMKGSWQSIAISSLPSKHMLKKQFHLLDEKLLPFTFLTCDEFLSFNSICPIVSPFLRLIFLFPHNSPISLESHSNQHSCRWLGSWGERWKEGRHFQILIRSLITESFWNLISLYIWILD